MEWSRRATAAFFTLMASSSSALHPVEIACANCDYANAHKNDRWQRYAATTAAAYTKELLGVLDVEETTRTKTTKDALGESNSTCTAHWY